MARNRLAENIQAIVNTFPPWSAARSDEQSLGFQVLNVLGVGHDDLYRQIEHVNRNYHLATANLNEIDLVYTFRLPGSFDFPIDQDIQGVRTLQAPTVSGLYSGISYLVEATDNNDLESFWYESLPSRFSYMENFDEDYFLASGYVFETPILNSGEYFVHSGLLPVPGRIWLLVSGSNNNLEIIGGIPARGLIQLEGVTREGLRDSVESLVFLHDEIQPTSKEWQQVEKICLFGINPEASATFLATSFRFNRGPYEDFYNLEVHPESKEPDPVFWNVASYNGRQVLEKGKYQVGTFSDRLLGYTGLEVVRRVELLDIDGGIIPNVADMAVEPFSTRLWVLTTGNRLFIYDKHMWYPDMGQARLKQYDALAVIEPSALHLVLDDQVTLEYFLRRPIKTIASHRVYLERPDGTRSLIIDGALQTYTATGGWTYGTGTGREVRNREIVTLNQRGDWLFTLEVRYTDDTTEVDQKIVSAESKRALAQYDMDDLTSFSGRTLIGLDFDSDQRLWLLDSTQTAHRVHPHFDVMLIDFDKKVLHFREPYESVRVLEE